jgi:hypothetical protein
MPATEHEVNHCRICGPLQVAKSKWVLSDQDYAQIKCYCDSGVKLTLHFLRPDTDPPSNSYDSSSKLAVAYMPPPQV